MKHGFVLVGIICLLCSCASTGGPGRNVDWDARESSAEYSGPLQLASEVEPADLRIPLLSIQAVATSMTPSVVTGRSSAIEPFGVDLGNGLAIDSGGNVFLDVLKLLNIDTTGSFQVSCSGEGLFSKPTTLSSDGGKVVLDSPRAGKGTVTQSPTVLALKPAKGKEKITITKTGDLLVYKSGIAFDRSWEMTPVEGGLDIKEKGLIGRTLEIRKEEETVRFNSKGSDLWPQYNVDKRGDAYFITYRSPQASLLYKVYYDDAAIYLMQNGIMILRIEKTESAVLVNGRKTVTYSRP